MFTLTTHPHVGTERIYIHQGASPYQPEPHDGKGVAVLFPGDVVTVESAWVRPYLDDTAPTLLYVLSHTTGQRTHVTADDLPLANFS